MKLAIISHTEHYLADGQIVGLGPTVREINQLLDVFEEIWHVAVLQPGTAPASALPYNSDKIHFVPLKPTGGPNWSHKWTALWHIPEVLATVRRTLQKVDCFQFRAPTGIGNVLIPYLSIFCKKPGWFKYAGNWVQTNAPLGYRWQRFWLAKLQKRPVTLNGRWPGQAPHLHAFENPCMSEREWEETQKRSQNKRFDAGLTLCFVGSLTPNKGAVQMLEAISKLDKPLFEKVLIAGDGPQRTELEMLAQKCPVEVELLGFQDRNQLNEIYTQSHFLLLPSENEGFPKVIAEAAAHGCIPIVTDVSCIGQYVRERENGFLLPNNSTHSIQDQLEKIRLLTQYFPAISAEASVLAQAFTYERYRNRILEMMAV